MAQLKAPRACIRMILPNYENGQSVIRQVGYVIKEGYDQPRTAPIVSGVIVVEIVRHAADDTKPDGIGDELPPDMQPREPIFLIGNNDTLLAADTGEVVAQRTTETPAQWQATIDAKAAELEPRPVVLQGDGLELIREDLVKIGEEIRKHLKAAPPEKFAPRGLSALPAQLALPLPTALPLALPAVAN